MPSLSLHPRHLLLTSALLLACPGEGQGDPSTGSETTAATTSPTTTAGTTSTTTTEATTTTSGEPPTTGNTADTADTSTGDPGTTTDASTTGDTGTTGEPAFCNGWQTAAGDPYLNLFDLKMAPLDDGDTLPLECGGQGTFMFGLYAQFGGFIPESAFVYFEVTVDVDGFNNNPDGHFYSADNFGYYVGCEPLDGGVFGVITVIPYDNLEDPAVLDGQPASVKVLMHAGDAEFTLLLDVVLSVKKDDSWALCGG